ALAYIIGTLAVAGIVAGTTYVLVSRTLTRDRVHAQLNQSFTKFRNLQVFLSGAQGYTTSQIVTQLQTRSTDVVVITRGTSSDSSSPDGRSDRSVSRRTPPGRSPKGTSTRVSPRAERTNSVSSHARSTR